MKKLLLSSFAVCLSLAVLAQPKPADPHAGHNHEKPATEKAVDIIKVEDVHDFGKIPQGKPVTYDFVVTNTGTTPWKINNIQAQCGCTTPNWEREKTIAPGESTKINVGYNAAAAGVFSKNITVTYNDNLTKVITIKGEVWQTPAASAPETKASEIKE